MEEITDKIVLVVLDYLDGHSAVRTHSRTKELLIATAEKLTQIAASIDVEKAQQSSQTSQIDDLTISCTQDVIDGVIYVCKSSGGRETAELNDQGINEVMQELGSITGSRGPSSKNNLEVVDLEETSVPVTSEAASSSSRQDHGSVLSDLFHQKVKHAVSDALLKTTGAVSVHSSKTFEDITIEDLEVCAEQSGTSSKSSVLVEEAASDIAETILEDLKKVSSQNGCVTEPARSVKTFRAAAYTLYKKIHFKVFGFLLRLQESESEKEHQTSSCISPPPHIKPRIEVQVGSYKDEVYVKVRETYRSEPLMSSCSFRRASSSTSPFAEEVHRHLDIGDMSITPEGPRESHPFFGLRRVKDFFRVLFTGAERPSTSHTPISSTDGQDTAEGQEVLKESLLLLGEHTLPGSTQDYKTPALAPTVSNNNDNVSVDPDPVTEKKKKGLRFSKHLSRTFSAIRRALPNPFQCVTGPP